jgi:hypothetical protein
VVSLNPIMIDGTGMCGGCRVLIDGKSEFACVDGPEFDAHRVDFSVLVQRNAMYRDSEQRSMDLFRAEKSAADSTSGNVGQKWGTPDRGARKKDVQNKNGCVAVSSPQGELR